jgi:hypothetical protein
MNATIGHRSCRSMRKTTFLWLLAACALAIAVSVGTSPAAAATTRVEVDYRDGLQTIQETPGANYYRWASTQIVIADRDGNLMAADIDASDDETWFEDDPAPPCLCPSVQDGIPDTTVDVSPDGRHLAFIDQRQDSNRQFWVAAGSTELCYGVDTCDATQPTNLHFDLHDPNGQTRSSDVVLDRHLQCYVAGSTPTSRHVGFEDCADGDGFPHDFVAPNPGELPTLCGAGAERKQKAGRRVVFHVYGADDTGCSASVSATLKIGRGKAHPLSSTPGGATVKAGGTSKGTLALSARERGKIRRALHHHKKVVVALSFAVEPDSGGGVIFTGAKVRLVS